MTREEIAHQFGGKLVGNKQFKKYVCQTLTFFPDEITDFITRTCWFMGSLPDAWAYAFTGNDLKDKHLIFLSDDLFEQDDRQIYFTIAHEIGHIILKHRNAIGYHQTRQEIAKQEKEADRFAHQFGF